MVYLLELIEEEAKRRGWWGDINAQMASLKFRLGNWVARADCLGDNMEVNVSFRVPLSGRKDTFELTGPCVCCGGRSEKVWDYHEEYELKKWDAGAKNQAVLKGYSDKSGKQAMGELAMKIPYCEVHMRQTNRLRGLTKTLTWVMVGITVLVTLLVFFNISLPAFGAAETTRNAGFWLCASPIIVALATLFVTMVITMGIRSYLGARPENADFPLTEEGGSGLMIKMEVVGGTPFEDFIKYYIDLGFQNIEAAKQFFEKYPQVIVTSGDQMIRV